MEKIIGQPTAVETLLTALASGRMHHAWVFSGPRGVGKFTTAVELARLLLDPNAETDLAGRPVVDPGSRTQQLIDAGSHPDLHIIRKEMATYSSVMQIRTRKQMNIPLDLIRELMVGGTTIDERNHEAPAYLTPTLGHGKVFIIDEAELLDRNAQNAILKTLEEPPRQTYIILVTDQYDLLLPTVRSRCQHVRFRLLDEKAMDQWFKRAALDVSAAELQWIREFADGAPGQALLAAEYKLYEWQQRLEPLLERLERGQPATDLGAALGELAEQFAVQWVKAHTNASKEAANRDATGKLLYLLSTLARRRAHEAIASGIDSEPWLRLIDAIAFTEREIDANVNMKLALESLAVQWGELTAS